MKPAVSAPEQQNEGAAFAYVEAKLWPDGPVCPKCGVVGRASRLQGKSVRPGLWKSYACRKQVHRPHGDHLRIQPCVAAYLAPGDLPHELA